MPAIQSGEKSDILEINKGNIPSNNKTPLLISPITNNFACTLQGVISPYPTVVIVTKLKYRASVGHEMFVEKFLSPPNDRKRPANEETMVNIMNKTTKIPADALGSIQSIRFFPYL